MVQNFADVAFNGSVGERQLGHRFQRQAADAGPFLDIVRQSSEALAASVEGLVQKQADVWAAALGEPEKRVAAMYKQAQEGATAAGGSGAAPGGSDAKKEDVVDAEFTEVDDDKKNKKSA